MPSSAKEFNRAMGVVLRRHREACGLTQTELGAALGVTFQQVQKYERGVNGLAAHYMPIVAAAFGISVADLYREADTIPPNLQSCAADNDAFLISRQIRKITDWRLRQAILAFAQKLAYLGVAS